MNDTNTPTDTEDVIDAIEQEIPDDHTPLADDLDASIVALKAQVEFGDSTNSPMPIGPEEGIELLRPMIRGKTDREPETVLRTLAILHLETGALLDKHSDVDPVNLVE